MEKRHSSEKSTGRGKYSKNVKKAAHKGGSQRSISMVSSSDSEGTDEMKSDKLTRQMVPPLGKRIKFAHFDRGHFYPSAKLFAKAGFPIAARYF